MSVEQLERAARESERLAVLTELETLRAALEAVDELDRYDELEFAFDALERLEARWR